MNILAFFKKIISLLFPKKNNTVTHTIDNPKWDDVKSPVTTDYPPFGYPGSSEGEERTFEGTPYVWSSIKEEWEKDNIGY